MARPSKRLRKLEHKIREGRPLEKEKGESFPASPDRIGFGFYAVVPEVTNAQFARDNQEFREACQLVKVKNTARQASKYRNGKGIVRGVL